MPPASTGRRLATLGTESGTILVVDDNPDTNDALVRLLRLRGYTVEGAFDGVEALGLLREGLEPSLIILDLRMPIMDGQEFLRTIADDPRFATLPVIIYSAVREAVLAAAVLAYVSKGRDLNTLLNTVETVCRKSLFH